MGTVLIIHKKPTKDMFYECYSDERIYKFIKACILSNWHYTKTYHFLVAYFNEHDTISIKVCSGNSQIKLKESETLIKDISFIKDIQKEYRDSGILNEAKLKYLLTDEN